MNYTEEQFDKLEQDERFLTDEAIAAMLLLLASTKNELEKELRSFYQQYGTDGVITFQEARKWVSEKDHRKRINVLLLFVTDEFNKLFIKLKPKFEEMLQEIADMEANFFDVDLDDYDFIDQTWGNDDSTWLDRLDEDIALWIAYIGNDIKQTMARGKHIDELLKKLERRFESIEYVLDKLGLTESTAIGSIARKRAFKALGITEYQFYTRADERTCETCGGMHGMIFPMTAFEVGVTASPLHPRCRCWEVPIWD